MLDAETKRRIDNARDILVGKVPDPKTQVEQITFAMIYKFMDDMDQLSVGIGGDPSFFTNGYEQFTWSKLLDKRMGGEARLDLYVRALDQMSQNPDIPQLFRDVFKGAFLPYRDSETLNLFLKEMNGFTYAHSEDLGDAYEYLLSIFASQGKAGQFRTPRHIIDFIVDCVNPSKDDTVLDPACGTAGFLISAYKHILEAQTQNPLSPDEKKRLTENFVGYDISPDMVRLSRVNMYLHQFANPTIHEYDTLTTEDRWDDNFDVILANPPFMTPKGGIRPHNRFAVRANRSEVLFVDYIAEHLNPGGRAGVIVPEGIIFQSNNAYKALRKMLVEENYLYAMVSLPAGVFNPYSGVKTSILLMDKTLARQSDSILFLKVSADGFDLGAQRRQIERNDVPEALRMVKAFQADPSAPLPESGLAQLVSKKRLAEGGEYNLSAERYRMNGVVNSKWPMVELESILDYEQPTDYIVDNINYSPDFPTPVLTAGKTFILGYTNEAKGIYSKELPVIIFDDFTTAIQLVNFPFKVKSSAMKILHANTKLVNIKYAFYMMQRITFNSSTHKRYWISEYSKIPIPLPPLEVQREIVKEIEGYQKVIDGARQVVENYKPVIPTDPSWPMIRLGEILSLEYGKPLKEANRKGGEYPVYGSNGIVGWHSDFLVEGPFIIVGRKGSAGEVTFSKKNGYPIDTTFFVKLLDKQKAELKFIYCLLKYLNLGSVNTQSGVPGLNRNDAYRIEVPLPSLEVQREIVEEIDNCQTLIDANKQIINLFEAKITTRIQRIWDYV
ncbi:MAG: N-6 DNA methylase [Anaerolineaceae bacterium]